MSVNIKVTGGLNIEWGQIDPKVTGGLNKSKMLDYAHFHIGFSQTLPLPLISMFLICLAFGHICALTRLGASYEEARWSKHVHLVRSHCRELSSCVSEQGT